MFETYKEMTQEDQERMKEVINKLYAQTFLLERKYDKKKGRMASNKDFYFCETHMEFLKQYFEIAGIAIRQNTELGSIYIQGSNMVGEKLPKLATIYLLLLKLLYDEKMAAVSSSVNIMISFGELSQKVGEFKLVKGLSSITEIKRAFAILKKYQMIEILDGLEELDEHTRIIIYPCINVVLMRDDIMKLLHSFEEVSEEEEYSDADDQITTSNESTGNFDARSEDQTEEAMQTEVKRDLRKEERNTSSINDNGHREETKAGGINAYGEE